MSETYTWGDRVVVQVGLVQRIGHVAMQRRDGWWEIALQDGRRMVVHVTDMQRALE